MQTTHYPDNVLGQTQACCIQQASFQGSILQACRREDSDSKQTETNTTFRIDKNSQLAIMNVLLVTVLILITHYSELRTTHIAPVNNH